MRGGENQISSIVNYRLWSSAVH